MRRHPDGRLRYCSDRTLWDSAGQQGRGSGLAIDALIGERVGERDAHLRFEFVCHEFLRLDEAADLLLAALPAPREVGFCEKSVFRCSRVVRTARLLLADIIHVHRSGSGWTKWLRAPRFGPSIVPAGAMRSCDWMAPLDRASGSPPVSPMNVQNVLTCPVSPWPKPWDRFLGGSTAFR